MTTKTLNQKVAHNIKKIRELKDLKQEFVAGQLAVGKTTYNDIENGKRGITLLELEKIARVFNTDVHNILDFDATNYYDVHHNHNGVVNYHPTTKEFALQEENNLLLKEEVERLKKEIDVPKERLTKKG